MIESVDQYFESNAGAVTLRFMLLASFKRYVKAMFWLRERKEFIFSPHHDAVCNALMDVYEGRTTYQIINIPPRYSKTELVVKMFVSWCYAQNPCCNFLHLSYSYDLVCDNSASIMEALSLPQYQRLFPNARLKRALGSKAHWETTAGGVFLARSSGGSITGFGAGNMHEVDRNGKFTFSGAIMIDDPLKPDDAYSDRLREFVNNRWHSTIKSRRNNPRTTPVIVIMQRIHEHDFTAMLEEDEPDKWKVLRRAALTVKPDGNKTALWPRMHDVAALEAMKAANIYSFASTSKTRHR